MTGVLWESRRILVTGADGFLGRSVVAALAREGVGTIVAADVREVPAERRLPGVTYRVQDVRDPALGQTLADHAIDSVVHLASIVTPGKGSSREFEYSVDVLGSQNVLDACVATGVKQLVVSSSGAAYGYHADNPAWLRETDALRGNEVFAYSHHKRLVEEMLAQYRTQHPGLAQTVLRIGTILGERVDNQITALFEKPRLLAIRGSESPFVFIWDEDVTGAILHALRTQRAGASTWRAMVPCPCARSPGAWANPCWSCPPGCCAPRWPWAPRSVSAATAPSSSTFCATGPCC